MGRVARRLRYDPATRTLSGYAMHGQAVSAYVGGAPSAVASAVASTADGSFSMVLPAGTDAAARVDLGMNAASYRRLDFSRILPPSA